jgi:hypothetical protein
MLALYLACLVVGGVLLALSLFGGGDSDLDVDVSADVEVSADLDVAADVDVPADVDAGGPDADAGAGDDAGSEAAGQGVAAAASLLSMRNLVFFLAFFGLTGTLLTLGRSGANATLLTSLALGTVAAAVVHRLMGFLRASESGAVASETVFAGARARVLIGISRTRPGKVTLEDGERTYELVARIHARAAVDHFERGDSVVVVRLQEGVALVAEPAYLA